MKLKISILFLSILLSGCVPVEQYGLNIPGVQSKTLTKKQNIKKKKFISIDVSKLNLHLKKIKTIPSNVSAYYIKRYPIDIYGKIIMDRNNHILGFINGDNHSTLWITRKKTLETTKIIQPIANKYFFFLFNKYKKIAFYNMKTGKYQRLAGSFRGFIDIEHDGIPEIVTVSGSYSDMKAHLYKIINVKNNPTLSLVTENHQPEDSDKGAYAYYDSVVFPRIVYDKQNNIVYIDGKQKVRTSSRTQSEKLLHQYYQKWNKGNVSIKSTRRDIDNAFIKYTDNDIGLLGLTKVDQIKLSASGLNQNGDFILFDPNEYKHEKWFYLPSLLIFENGKGYTRLTDGRLAIFDWDMDSGQGRNISISKIEIFGGELFLISSEKKYLVLYDVISNKNRLYLWKKLLGYQPLFIKYFDGKRLVVIDQRKNIKVYKVSFSFSKVKKVTW